MKEKLVLDIANVEQVSSICHAMSSPIRLRILSLIEEKPLNISELSQQLQIPLSTTAQSIAILEKAGLIISTSKPGVRGAQKLCALKVDSLFMQIKNTSDTGSEDVYVQQMPIGNYSDFRVNAPCGIVTEKAFIAPEDSPYGFFLPEHTQAQLLWFTSGHLEYRFFNKFLRRSTLPKSVEFSFELCSEAPGYNSEWRSEITVWLNDRRIGCLVSLGDYGNRRGRLNPSWWDYNNTQYGILHRVCITAEGTLLDDALYPEFTIDHLKPGDQDYLSFKIGVEESARYVGGLNLFGEKFGDYPQAIVMRAVF